MGNQGNTNYLEVEDIKRIRAENNLSQGDLAKLLNVGQVTVARWETGERKCKGEYANKIKALDEDWNVKNYELDGEVIIKFEINNLKGKIKSNEENFLNNKETMMVKGINFIGTVNINVGEKDNE